MSAYDTNGPTFFRHRRVNNIFFQRFGDITAAVRLNKNDDAAPTFDVAFVFCSKHDQFEKSVGREFATKRLVDGNFVTITQEDADNCGGVVEAALNELFDLDAHTGLIANFDTERPSFVPQRIWKNRESIFFDSRRGTV
tara:strand:+ start:905 stop:1321 length:417 start_codon:yes stop_codon:yes gene_type:complete